LQILSIVGPPNPDVFNSNARSERSNYD